MQEIPFNSTKSTLLSTDWQVSLLLVVILVLLWFGLGFVFLLYFNEAHTQQKSVFFWLLFAWLVLAGTIVWVAFFTHQRFTQQTETNRQLTSMQPTEQDLLHYSLSHDLRAPLRIIEGFARILKEEEGPKMGRMSNEHLDRLLAAAERMDAMLNAVLTQAQLTQSAIKQERVDLSNLALLISIELQNNRHTDNTHISIDKDIDWNIAQGMQATGDQALLRRVLENLMGNAVKYSSKVAQPKVEIGMIDAANPKIFYVRDNGAGFDMQHAQRLFGLFQRLHSVKEFPGSGVGLAGVQIIVHRHGGRIWAEAQPGKGACFYFTLPQPNRP